MLTREASDSIEMAFTISQEHKHSRIDFLCVFMVIRWKYIDKNFNDNGKQCTLVEVVVTNL